MEERIPGEVTLQPKGVQTPPGGGTASLVGRQQRKEGGRWELVRTAQVSGQIMERLPGTLEVPRGAGDG